MTDTSPLKTLVIVGSTRPNRMADLVVPWLQRALEADDRLDVSIADLRDWPLPMFQEDLASMGDPMNPTYSEPIVQRWNDTVSAAEAFVFVTPEYNHTIPPALKNAIDSVYVSPGIRNKPCGYVGYSISPTGAVRAIEHLYQVAVTLEAMPLRNSVLIGQAPGAFDQDGEPTSPMTGAVLGIMADDLVWWGRALRDARAAGQLPPTPFRMMQAMAAIQESTPDSTAGRHDAP